MSTESFELRAQPRNERGKAASRRLRRQGMVPGIIYGGKGEPTPIAVEQNELMSHLDHEAFYSHILTVHVGRRKEQVILKALHRHAFKPKVEHLDLQRVVADEPIRVQVPVHFVGEETAPGNKAGGVVAHQLNEIEVECLPRYLPEYLEVDISELEIGDTVHLQDIATPEGVQFVTLMHDPEDNPPVVSINPPRVEPVEEEEEAEAEAEAEEGAEEAEGGEEQTAAPSEQEASESSGEDSGEQGDSGSEGGADTDTDQDRG